MALPYSWAIGHDVRPASQSLGVKSCQDCHSQDAPFFFGTIAALGPLQVARPLVEKAIALQGLDEGYNRAFAATFRGRSLFKAFGILALLAIGLALLEGLRRSIAPARPSIGEGS